MFCDIKCLLCDQDQTSKINYSLYHGVCAFHKFALNPILVCHYCNSNVSVNQIIDMSKCEVCSDITIKGLSPCGHILCENCEKECSLCKNKTIDLYGSLSFRQQIIEELPKTQTLISEGYNSENPDIIHLGNSISKIKCEYCIDKIAINFCAHKHFLCNDCLTEGNCNLCDFLAREYLEYKSMSKSELFIGEKGLNCFTNMPHAYVAKGGQDKYASQNHENYSSAEVIVVFDSLPDNLNMENTLNIQKQEKVLEHEKPKEINKSMSYSSDIYNSSESISCESRRDSKPLNADPEFMENKKKTRGSVKIRPDESFLLNIRNLAQTERPKNTLKFGEDETKDYLLNTNSKDQSYKFELLKDNLDENSAKTKTPNQNSDSTSNNFNNTKNVVTQSKVSASAGENEDDEKCCCTLF
ncbi:hypothetical protein SteCoe_11393 [Stentor coeruleus]|uniref:RING-type domain-containing protein n=1 Tax=Stentor coeruleus TaxID=5963 RepID=A0A1R2CD92_9CILI|nr:hypothetical protein SteCoe_11393 [Stentor coeruleus]